MAIKKKKTRFSGVMSIEGKDRDNTYQIRATFQEPTTKRQHERVRIINDVSLVEAEERRIELYKDLKKEVIGIRTSTHKLSSKTFKEYSEWYFKFVVDNDIRTINSSNKSKSLCNSMITPILGNIIMSDITKEHIRMFADQVQNIRKNGVDLYSNQTFLTAYRLLKAMLNTAVCEDILKVRITDNIRIQFKYGKKSKQKNSLTFDEVNRLLDTSARELDFACFVALACSTGMRVGELIALTWDDVDFSKEYIKVSKTYDAGILKNSVKNGNNHTLPLPNFAKDRLIQHRKETLGSFNPKNLVFKGKRNNGYTNPLYYNNRLKKYCDAAGIDKHITNHSLRYTANTLLFLSGVDPLVIQKILNHKSGDIMSLKYLSMDKDTKKKIVDEVWQK